jgi:hypothetical protein
MHTIFYNNYEGFRKWENMWYLILFRGTLNMMWKFKRYAIRNQKTTDDRLGKLHFDLPDDVLIPKHCDIYGNVVRYYVDIYIWLM